MSKRQRKKAMLARGYYFPLEERLERFRVEDPEGYELAQYEMLRKVFFDTVATATAHKIDREILGK